MAPPTITGVFDTACTVNFDGDRESPPAERPFYRHNQTCSPNVEGILDYHLEAELLQFYLDVVGGENAGYTQPAGWQGGQFDLVQAFFRWGGDYYVEGGRLVTNMGAELIQADKNNLIFRSPNFGKIPYTETGIGAGYRWREDRFKLNVRLMPVGPDAIEAGHGRPTVAANVSAKVSEALSLAGNYEAGLARNGRHTADLNVTLAPDPAFSLGAYVLYRTEEFEAGRQDSYGWDIYLGLNPYDWLSVFFRAGSSRDRGGGIEEQRISHITFGPNFKWKAGPVEGQVRLQLTTFNSVTGREPDEEERIRANLAAQVLAVF